MMRYRLPRVKLDVVRRRAWVIGLFSLGLNVVLGLGLGAQMRANRTHQNLMAQTADLGLHTRELSMLYGAQQETMVSIYEAYALMLQGHEGAADRYARQLAVFNQRAKEMAFLAQKIKSRVDALEVL